MEQHEKSLFTLVAVGALIAIGKLLASNEVLTWRVIIGRTLLGSASSMVAGVALVQVPDLDPIGLVGLGAALGIFGAQALESWFKRQAQAYGS